MCVKIMYNKILRFRFIYINKIVLYILCSILVLTLLKNIKLLNIQAWYFLPIRLNYEEKVSGFKYILLWTNPNNVPFSDMGTGRMGFISRNCAFTNCVVTANKSLLGDYSLFDVIAFHGPELQYMDDNDFPKKRLPHQKYVFASIESSDYYPICSDKFDGYFNWTWTYRLDSELRWGYIVIKDAKGNVIGPKKDINWLHGFEMRHVSQELKNQLKTKTKAIAWFVSNCQTKSLREAFALALRKYLERYNLRVDIYGSCGSFLCPREESVQCNKKIANDYYFYLSFENAFSVDYVTEKLLIPLQNNAIPIVYGGANYTRFLPHGSYLDARDLGLYALGDKINELIKNFDKYVEYFKWKNHYSYYKMSESVDTNEYCQMCALLNDNEAVASTSVYENFREWWNPLFNDC